VEITVDFLAVPSVLVLLCGAKTVILRSKKQFFRVSQAPVHSGTKKFQKA
jgi:hypothetical protein